MMPANQAEATILDHITCFTSAQTETLPLLEAQGRVLAKDVHSALDFPHWDNSAMDGYAVRATEAHTALPVSQRIPAGASAQPLAPNSAARIFTGAPVPEGADTVVMQENCEADGDGLVRFVARIQMTQRLFKTTSDKLWNFTMISLRGIALVT